MKIDLRLVSVLILAAASGVSAAERPTAKEVLGAYQQSVEALARVRIESVTSRPKVQVSPESSVVPTIELKLIRDGEAARWKLDEVTTRETTKNGMRSQSRTRVQAVVNGQETVRAQISDSNTNDSTSQPIVSVFRDEHPHRVWRTLGLTSVLFGRFDGDGGEPLWTVMGQAAMLEVLPETETIADAETWVVRSRGKYGEHKVWFDPKSSLPRRIEIRKTAGNLFNDDQLGTRPANDPATKPKAGSPTPPRARREAWIEIDNIQGEKKSGVFVVTGFEYSIAFDDAIASGAKAKTKWELRSIAIETQALPAELFGFDISIPNGHPVAVFEKLPIEFGNARASSTEEWFDGKGRRRAGQP